MITDIIRTVGALSVSRRNGVTTDSGTSFCQDPECQILDRKRSK